jgi:hypothetical protein
VAAPRRDHVVDVAERIDAMADDWLAGRSIRDADAGAVAGATPATRRAALDLLRLADERLHSDEERDHALDEMASRVLREIADRERAFNV